jgi:hypothetical protein
MVDTTFLRALLVDDLFGAISEKDGRRFARLKERGAEAKLKRVDIFDIPEGSLLLNLDQYEQPISLFRGEQGERQRCDYVLVTAMETVPLLVFIEIKSSILKNSEIQRQFKGAECVLDYCDAALDRFHGQNGFLRQFKKRFVVFYRPRLAKQRTRPTVPSKKNNAPELALKYPSPTCPSLKALVVL